GLRGMEVSLPYPSVSTTENILMLATRARGTSVLRNVAGEPEVMDLVHFLQKMGAIIDMTTDRTFIVEGRERLKGAVHNILPDRIACASYGAMALATGGHVKVLGARQGHMLSFLNTLRRMDAPFEVTEDGIAFGSGEKCLLKPISLETGVHPGFMTDWQPPMLVLMARAQGLSVLHETVYENRLEYTETLNRMGAKIQVETHCLGGTHCRFHCKDFRHSAIVHGPTPLVGLDMEVPDLRAGFTYVIAALCARGQSTIGGVEHIERGYGDLCTLLQGLGAAIERKA
ncbi:MAG: UDP-N-acetylglucosamine 1-carboxyvinyltransferase, partial [Planctomycetes bacterium]|nr:UDP-N-acetylglucosamine 1-carboxyvinyltransferase [Planctomycetota bacterium]